MLQPSFSQLRQRRHAEGSFAQTVDVVRQFAFSEGPAAFSGRSAHGFLFTMLRQ